MLHKTFVFGGPLLVAAALTLLTPGTSQAQPGGFRGGSGFQGGGFQPGSSNAGGFNPARYRPATPVDYNHYYFAYGSYRPGYEPSRSSYGGYSVPYTFDSSGLLPGSAYSGSYYPRASYLGSATTFRDPLYLGSNQLTLGSLALVPSRTNARVTVAVPADAEVWFNNMPTASTGAVREFESPPLASGKYTYEVKVRWKENGQEVTQAQQVEVTAGAQVTVRFPVAPKN